MDWLRTVNSWINGIVWGPFMLLLMMGVGVFFTIKLRCFQLLGFRTWWKKTAMSVFSSGKTGNKSGGISPMQAMTTALAGSVGTGNIVGVAGAITLGGAGAVFWMWVAAFLGMATAYAENVLGVRYRVLKNGKYCGGPMYYMEYGLGSRKLGICFAAVCTVAALGMGNMTQGNSVSGALWLEFGIPVPVSGAVLAVLVAVLISGGIGRIAGMTEKLVPLMTAVFLIGVFIVLSVNFYSIPSAFGRIVTEAFDLRAVSGGFLGHRMMAAMRYGVSRGVFSNEAGLGTSPIVHAAAETADPSEEGMWGFFQVFIDTIVLCTLMALCILVTGSDSGGYDGIAVSTAVFESVLGRSGRLMMSVCVILFAFGTLVSWSYYGEKSLEYLTGGKYIKTYRLVYAAVTFVGCITGIDLVWEISDTLNGLMALPNLAAILLLSNQIICPHRISGHKCPLADKKTE